MLADPFLRLPHHLGQALLHDLRCGRAAADEENRVVAGDRAGHFGELRAIDPLRQTLRLPAVRAKDQQRIDPLVSPQQGRHRTPQLISSRRLRPLAARPDVGTITGPFDEPYLLEITGDSGLSRVNSPLLQPLPQELLRRDGLVVDDVQNLGLSPLLHKYSKRPCIIHRLHTNKTQKHTTFKLQIPLDVQVGELYIYFF